MVEVAVNALFVLTLEVSVIAWNQTRRKRLCEKPCVSRGAYGAPQCLKWPLISFSVYKTAALSLFIYATTLFVWQSRNSSLAGNSVNGLRNAGSSNGFDSW